MKNIGVRILFLLLFSNGYTQCNFSIPSPNGYTVDVTLQAISIQAPNGCPNGYNYNVRIHYDISISSGGPSNLYTLQGYMGCIQSSYIFFDLPNNGGHGVTVTNGNPWNPNSDCSTATVSSLGCNMYTLIIQGPGIPYQEISCSATTPLPVELVDFEAQRDFRNIELSWKTATESNNDYFAVERSEDGIDWNLIGKVDGAGNSTDLQSYNYLDTEDPSLTLYYRLKQVDFDGAFTYSETRVVNPDGNISGKIYPNPANDNITLFRTTNSDGSPVRLFNLLGQEFELNVIGSSSEGSMTFDISKLRSGVYFIQIGNESIKFVKR